MRLEHFPVILGVLFALVGLALLADAFMEDGVVVPAERRRRPRAPRDSRGEAIIGVGILLFAAALVGQDAWRYGTLAMLTGSACILVGAVMNRTFIREAVLNRGAARRAEGALPPARGPDAPVHNPKRSEPEERRKQPR